MPNLLEAYADRGMGRRSDPDRDAALTRTMRGISEERRRRRLTGGREGTSDALAALRGEAAARGRWQPLIARTAHRYGLRPELLDALVKAESNYNARALSSRGAMGLGQLMPGTAADLGVDPWNPEQNLAGAARYLAQLMEQFGGERQALAAYNMGPDALRRRAGRPYRETQAYVDAVLGRAGEAPGGATARVAVPGPLPVPAPVQRPSPPPLPFGLPSTPWSTPLLTALALRARGLL